MLVGTDDGGVSLDVPGDQVLDILVLERGDDPALLRTATGVRKRGLGILGNAMAHHLPDLPAAQRGQMTQDLARLLMAFFDGAFIAREVDTDAAGCRHLFTLAATAVAALTSRQPPSWCRIRQRSPWCWRSGGDRAVRVVSRGALSSELREPSCAASRGCGRGGGAGFARPLV
ncbi:hypothetical protein AQJ23_16470 [Streptomyces antibioticus]|nr:hypothetical protein [Streptomyces antibioticus]KUN25475.1 hypothetical protein AQJ23_16470 [Streptomyces antibioticus]